MKGKVNDNIKQFLVDVIIIIIVSMKIPNKIKEI